VLLELSKFQINRHNQESDQADARGQTDLPGIMFFTRFLDQSVLLKKLRIFSEPSDRACLADLFLS
jgi:hypothetical protein